MGALRYFGTGSTGPTEVTTKGYIQNLLSANYTQAQVDSAISARLAVYADLTYVKTQDAKLADSVFIDNADKTRLPKTSLNQPNQPFTLGADGKIPPALVTVTTQQKYPNTLSIPTTTSGSSTSSDVSIFVVNVPDPGYSYKLLVSGTVHAQVGVDTGAIPRVSVYRPDNTLVAVGYGVGESYQAPSLGASSSRMYVNTPFTPSYATARWFPAPFLQPQTTYTSDWQSLTWNGINNDSYTTTIDGVYLKANSTMSGCTLTAQISFVNGVIPPAAFVPGTLTPEIQIYSSSRGAAIASSPIPADLSQTSGTLTCYASNVAVTKGDLFTVQVRQTIFSPWGTLFPGGFATWAPTATGTGNTLTLVPGLSGDLSTAEIPIIPKDLTTQSAITGSTTLTVRLQSPSSVPVTSYPVPTPRLTAIPIPA